MLTKNSDLPFSKIQCYNVIRALWGLTKILVFTFHFDCFHFINSIDLLTCLTFYLMFEQFKETMIKRPNIYA